MARRSSTKAEREVDGAHSLRSPVALVLLDVINEFDFPGAAALARHAVPTARRLRRLRERARSAGVPTIYVNDNFGRWRSDLRAIVAHVAEGGGAGARIAAELAPAEDDLFVLKPRNSGFHDTALETLLASLGVRTVVLAGFAGDICVLFSANDAHGRGFCLVVPGDCIASERPAQNRAALALMRKAFGADTRRSSTVDFATLRRSRPRTP
jgi:nicotinamidase-related amidase